MLEIQDLVVDKTAGQDLRADLGGLDQIGFGIGQDGAGSSHIIQATQLPLL